MEMKIALVTGATDGIGLETAHQLGLSGHKVLVHGRTEKKAQAACQTLARRNAKGVFVPVWGDFSALSEVRALAKQVQSATPHLDVLINNAGLFATQAGRSRDGHELTCAVNYLAPFALTHALLKQLQAAPQGRVVTLTSVAHAKGKVSVDTLGTEKTYQPHAAYASASLMQVLFTHELAKRLKKSSVTAYAVHPGVIDTKLLRAGFKSPGAPVTEGVSTSVWCATAPELAGQSGRYYAHQRETVCAAVAENPSLEAALYMKSCALTGVGALPA